MICCRLLVTAIDEEDVFLLKFNDQIWIVFDTRGVPACEICWLFWRSVDGLGWKGGNGCLRLGLEGLLDSWGQKDEFLTEVII